MEQMIEHHDADGNVVPLDIEFDQTLPLDWLARSVEAALRTGGHAVAVRLDAPEARALVDFIDRVNGTGSN